MRPAPVVRSALSLNGLWDFAFLGDAAPVEVDFTTAFNNAELMPVPAAFDALPTYAGQRGLAIYRTRFTVPAEHPARLEFGAVSMWTQVFVDAVLLRTHACGYAPFDIEVTPSDELSRELILIVDNRFDFDRAPMHGPAFDFYQYGGIIRDVSLQILPRTGPSIRRLTVIPAADYRQGGVNVGIALTGEVGPTISFSVQFDDGEAVTFADQNVAKNGEVTLDLVVPAPHLWSPESPRLHHLRVALHHPADGHETDAAVTRFGLRHIEAREGALWFNGERLQLRGYNRHEWHPNFGPATPTLQMVADIQLLRDLGCNFVRGSHYPQDQRFLDLCDEFGLLVWEENLGWGQRAATFASQKFRADHAETLEAMVRRSINHPCVIMWGFLNEAGSNADYVRPIFEESVALIRRLDPSRLVSFASMFALTDRHFDLVDVISLNIYPGWYDCEDHPRPLELIRPRIRECLTHLDAQGLTAKPIIISEIGAEGLYGWHDPHNDFFTETYQAAYLREACEGALSESRCSGIALWHFSDVRTYGGGRSMKRPRAFNNKGTLDEYRRPKLAYRAVQAVFQSFASPAPVN